MWRTWLRLRVISDLNYAYHCHLLGCPESSLTLARAICSRSWKHVLCSGEIHPPTKFTIPPPSQYHSGSGRNNWYLCPNIRVRCRREVNLVVGKKIVISYPFVPAAVLILLVQQHKFKGTDAHWHFKQLSEVTAAFLLPLFPLETMRMLHTDSQLTTVRLRLCFRVCHLSTSLLNRSTLHCQHD